MRKVDTPIATAAEKGPEPANETGQILVTTATLRPGERFRDGPLCPQLVVVPAGTFRMGSPHRIWIPSAKSGLSETAREFLLCMGSPPKTTEAILANVRDRLFGWIRQYEQNSGRTLRDAVEDSRMLSCYPDIQWELRDGNLDWLEESLLNEGLGRLAWEALDSGYELNQEFLSPLFWSGSDEWWEFDADYFHTFEDALVPTDRFWSSREENSPAEPVEDCDVVFPDGFDGLSDEHGRSYREGPVHPVTFDKPFAVGMYPVSRGEFQAFEDATGYRAQGHGCSSRRRHLQGAHRLQVARSRVLPNEFSPGRVRELERRAGIRPVVVCYHRGRVPSLERVRVGVRCPGGHDDPVSRR